VPQFVRQRVRQRVRHALSPGAARRGGRRRAGAAAAALCTAVLAGCEFDHTVVPQGPEQIVVHAVLNPGRPTQRILVERTLTGRVEIPSDQQFDVRDPIATGGGVPITDARVVVYSDADSAVLAERTPGIEGGTGVYEFLNSPDTLADDSTFVDTRPRLVVQPGAQYRLRVTAPDGRVVTAVTTVPEAQPVPAISGPERFDRDADSLFVFWEEVPLANRYLLRIDSPRGPFALFVDSLEYLVSGSLRNVFVDQLPRVFVPGFTQTVQVAAVDESFYDYFRSFNNPFTGTGIINHLEGGIGLFGSYVLLRYRTLDVTAPPRYPFEGTYVFESGADGRAPTSLRIYVESASATTYALSGNYTPTAPQPAPPGLLGSYDGSRITVALLRAQLASDTANVLTGRLEGDILSGTFGAGDPPVRYRRR